MLLLPCDCDGETITEEDCAGTAGAKCESETEIEAEGIDGVDESEASVLVAIVVFDIVVPALIQYTLQSLLDIINYIQLRLFHFV